jgi:hypothetical protein
MTRKLRKSKGLPPECFQPWVECRCCKPNEDNMGDHAMAYFLYTPGRSSRIVICYNRYGSLISDSAVVPQAVLDSFNHEMWHVWQLCDKSFPGAAGVRAHLDISVDDGVQVV